MRFLSFLCTLVVASASIAVATETPAAGQICSGEGNIYDGAGEVDALCQTEGPGAGPGSRVTPRQRWDAYCTDYENVLETYPYVDGADVSFSSWRDMTEAEVERLGLNPTGVYGAFRAHCDHPVTPGEGGTFYYTITDPIPIDVLLDEVKERIEIDDPPIDSNPSFSERFAVVRIPTWLWVDEAYWNQDNLERETRGFVTVEVWAEPVDLRWWFSGGSYETDCPEGPGTPWTSGAGEPECSVLFSQSSAGEPADAFRGEAAVSWQFYWTLNGADQGPFDELLDLTTEFDIQVGEIQAVERG